MKNYFFKNIEKIDIFGLAVTFRIVQEKNHKTKIGGFFTVIISSIIIYQLFSLTKFVYDQDSPIVIQQQNYVQQPELFSISPKTFSFAFGIQDSIGRHFIDETIYKIKALQQINTRVMNATTGNYDLITKFRDVKISICTKEHFQIEEIKSYFLKLPLNTLYCISLDEQEISIEGEFSALVFKQFNIQVLECSGTSCTDDNVRQKKLVTARLAIYTSDNIIQMTDISKPYKQIGKNLFWIQSTSLESEVRYQIMNNYVHSDVGLLRSNTKLDRVVSYSSDRTQVYGRSTSRMFNFYINYEKNKEVVYYRKYMKLDQAFSQVGGTFNILVAIGCFLCRPISQLELNRKLLNTIFEIEEFDQEKGSKPKQYKQNKNQQINQNKLTELQSKLCKGKSSTSKSQLQQASCSPSQLQSENNIIQQKKSMDIQQQTNNQRSSINDNYNEDLSQNQIESQSKQHKLKFHFIEYLLSFFRVFKKQKDSKYQLIKYGTDIIYSHIDIFNIINKLIEVEKLKHLLLNENQLRLFDYLPKPALKYNEVKQEINRTHQNKEGQQQRLNFQPSFISKSANSGDQMNQFNQETDFIVTAQKTQKEKTSDALKAYNTIVNIKKKSKIDEKLIQMLDINFIQQFQTLYSNKCIQIQEEILYHKDNAKQRDNLNTISQQQTKNNNLDIQLISINELSGKQTDPNTDGLFSPQFTTSGNHYIPKQSIHHKKQLSTSGIHQTNQSYQIEEYCSDSPSLLPNIATQYNFRSNTCEINKDLKQ